jgi:hypothetical protein
MCVLAVNAQLTLFQNEAYIRLTPQLLNNKNNIEYVAANLEAGALRALSRGYPPTAFNSAAWHLKGIQTDEEIIRRGWNPGAAKTILDEIPIALSVMNLTSSWKLATEPQYWSNR